VSVTCCAFHIRWSEDFGSGPSAVVLKRTSNPKLEEYLQWWARSQYPPRESCEKRELVLYNNLGRYWASLAHVTSMEFGMQNQEPCGDYVQNGLIIDVQMVLKKNELTRYQYCSTLPGLSSTQSYTANLWRCFFLPLSSCDTSGNSNGRWNDNDGADSLFLAKSSRERVSGDDIRSALEKSGAWGKRGGCKTPLPSTMEVGDPLDRFLGLSRWTVHYPRFNTTKVSIVHYPRFNTTKVSIVHYPRFNTTKVSIVHYPRFNTTKV
jgi:hypothetical protein